MTLTDATWTLYDALGRSVGHCRARNHAEAVFLLHLSDERAASGWSVSEDAACLGEAFLVEYLKP